MEILLTAAALPETPAVDTPPTSPEPTSLLDFDWHYLVDHDLWSEVPDDVDGLLQRLATSDLYVQDEVDVRLHPTLSRVWSRKGKRGQRLVRAPGKSRRFVGFGAIDWREGWLSIGYGLHRSAEVYCQQLDHLVDRSSGRDRNVIVLADNLGIHTPEGSKLLRETLKKHEGKLRLVYTPPYDPEANPTERFWPPFRLTVTHNHHRDDLVSLYQDAVDYFDQLDRDPNLVLRHIGSPQATTEPSTESTNRSTMTPSLTGRS